MKNTRHLFSRTGRILLLAAAVCGGWLSRPAPAAAQETLRQYLSGHDAESPVPWEFFCSQGRNSGVWTNIPVPSCWETQGFGTFRYGLEDKPFAPIESNYRHRFDAPSDWSGRRVFLVFDGVMTDATVKINGQEAGPLHQGAFYRFKYDVTGKIKLGGENLLEVTVSDKSANASVNNAERYADYWVFGGIFRPVWLEAQPAQFVERVAIDARADGSFALNYFLGGEGGADAVEVAIQDAQGKAAAPPVSAPVAAGHVNTKVAQPALWTAETPALYTAVVRLKQGATVLHEMKQRFGLRTVEVRAGDGIYINDTRVMFRGVCHHVAWPTLGRSSSARIAKLDIGLIHEMNMDAARMSHYPPDEDFLDLCDEEGLYILDELGGWQHRYDTDIGRARLQDMIARDVNHPCIVLWDNGNEGGWNTNLDADYAQLDPQRRAVVHPQAKFGDINAKHYPDYRTLTQLLASNVIVMPTEFLHGLYDGGAGAGLDDYWNAMRASKVSAGGFIWVFADEGVRRNDSNNIIDVKGNWAPDGIMGPYREKEASFYTIKEIYSPVQLPRALPKDFDGTLPVENRYEFTSLSKCSFTWRLRRFYSMPGSGDPLTIANGSSASPDVAPGRSGTLQLGLPANWKIRDADALEVMARDSAGRELWTWVFGGHRQTFFTLRPV
jgi:beta-galactosidase/beta-glucuronidase